MIKASLPPSPKAPAFLQLIQWIADPVAYMESAKQQYGDIFTAKVGAKLGDIVFVGDPHAVQQILTSDRKQFSAPGEVNKILSILLGDSSVIMLEGDAHKQRRQLLMPPFHGERLKAYGQLICTLSEKVMDRFLSGDRFLARSVMQEISLQVIIEAVFGLHEGERYQQLKQLLAELLEIFRTPWKTATFFFRFLQWDLGTSSPWGRFLDRQRQIDALLSAEIAERRAHPDSNRSDILSLLMSATDEDGKGLSDRALHDELLTVLFAGHETTTTMMAWTLYWTHSLSDVKQKLLTELASLGDNRDPVEIARLPYLTAVCQETLRIYPVAMLTFPRVVQEPVELGGYHFEPGAILAGCMYLIHQREDIYPQHQQFKPERFLEKQFSPYEFMPFGGGARRCLGDTLVLFEMKLVLATFLWHYELTLSDSRPEKPRRRGVTLAPERGVPMVMLGRRLS